jgi:hypothetical protein
MIKTAKIIPALIRNTLSSKNPYKIPPVIKPIILAKLPKLLAIPCTAP